MLQESARDLFASMSPVAMVRQLRDEQRELPYADGLWSSMCDLGFAGVNISEEYGGLSFGFRGLGLIFEESGRSLSASPLLSTALCSHLMQKYGSESQKSFYLPEFASGSSRMSLGLQESSHFDPLHCETTAVKDSEGYLVNGTKRFVMDGVDTSGYIVSARTSGESKDKEGLSMFLIPSNAPGCSTSKEYMMDGRHYSTVELKDVRVSEDHLIGNVDEAYRQISHISDVANVLLSAELVGIMTEAFQRTLAYLKERRQFDRLIGSFQSLQHRMADMYGEIEVCKSLVIMALDGLDGDSSMLPMLASMAKARCAKIADQVTNEGIQMFGGIGMTDDEEIGFFLKRARVVVQLFGGRSYHLDRYANINGF